MAANQNKIVKLVLSDDTFGGFEHHYQIIPGTTMDDLINSILGKLRETLAYHNLENARIVLQGKHFHIHGITIASLTSGNHNNDTSLTSGNHNNDTTIYVCSH